jgi:hypothetical protein
MLVVVSDRGEQIGHVAVVQRVVRVATLAPNTNQAKRPQQSQMVGSGALSELGGRGELIDRALALEQGEQQTQSTGGTEPLESAR